MDKIPPREIAEFLLESNAIEGVYDMDSFSQALYAWLYLMKEKKMSPGTILKTHKILMLNQKGLMPNEKGYFREVPVFIGGRVAINAGLIRPLIEDWCKDMNDNAGPDEEHSKHLHIRYEKIHPFVDGNGRTGRMFMNWWRIKNGLPLLTIHEGAEQQDYYQWFKKA